MFPAQQGLKAGYAVVGQAELRLIDEAEAFRVIRQGIAQIAFQFAAIVQGLCHRAVEGAPDALAIGFRLVERHIRVAHQHIHIVGVLREQREAQAAAGMGAGAHEPVADTGMNG